MRAPAGPAAPAPDSSALGTKPRAPLAATSGPKSASSRLEVSTTAGPAAVARELRCDLEAVDVGQLHVEQHQVGGERARLAQAGRAVARLPHDVEALRFEQESRRGAEARVVVDDQHADGHLLPSSHTRERPPVRLASPSRRTMEPRGGRAERCEGVGGVAERVAATARRLSRALAERPARPASGGPRLRYTARDLLATAVGVWAAARIGQDIAYPA